jgi:hypothetical protein
MASAATKVIERSTERTEAANSLDVQIRKEWQKSEGSLIRLSAMFNRMRDEVLWAELIDMDTKDPYRRFSDYVYAVTGKKVGHTRLYDMLAIYGLTQGPDALDPKDVDEMGSKNAAEVARLDPKDRTPDVVEAAKKESTRKLKKIVQEKLNEKLDPEDRKEATFMFARSLDEATIDLIELIEKDGEWIEAVRDADRSLGRLQKLWAYVWAKFAVDYREELEDGRRYREAMEAAQVREVLGEDEADEEAPPEPDEHDATLQAMARDGDGSCQRS